MAHIPSLGGSEQARLLKVGAGHYKETWPEALGFNLLEADLKPIKILLKIEPQRLSFLFLRYVCLFYLFAL